MTVVSGFIVTICYNRIYLMDVYHVIILYRNFTYIILDGSCVHKIHMLLCQTYHITKFHQLNILSTGLRS